MDWDGLAGLKGRDGLVKGMDWDGFGQIRLDSNGFGQIGMDCDGLGWIGWNTPT